MNTPLASEMTTPSKQKDNKILAIVAIGMFAILLLAIGLVIFNNIPKETSQQNNNNDRVALLAENTCPDSLSNDNGRPIAILNGTTFQMSEATYNWVQQNCSLDNQNGRVMSIVLTNLGIDIGKYDEMTGRAGAFIFDKEALKTNIPYKKIFIEFGATETKTDGDFATKTFPEIVYNQVDADTDITSLSDGTVFMIDEQPETKDFDLIIMYNNFWTVVYDHIRDLNVTKGEKVKAGQILGKVSLNKDGITGYTEIQVKYAVNGSGIATSYCPVSLLNDDVKTTYLGKLTTLMEDWETYYGDNTIYNETAQVVPGCVQETYQE